MPALGRELHRFAAGLSAVWLLAGRSCRASYVDPCGDNAVRKLGNVSEGEGSRKCENTLPWPIMSASICVSRFSAKSHSAVVHDHQDVNRVASNTTPLNSASAMLDLFSWWLTNEAKLLSSLNFSLKLLHSLGRPRDTPSACG